MAFQESQIVTKDNLKLLTRAWMSEKPPKAMVVIVHGIGEHSGRYGHVAKAFNVFGIHTFAYDQRGHGKSEGPRGHTPTNQHLMDDLSLAIDEARQLAGENLPIFLYGHSMGGLEVLYYGLHNLNGIKGYISTGPSIQIASTDPLKILLAKTMTPFLPKLTLSSGLDVTALSRDAQVIREYQDDPLVHDLCSTRLGMFIIGGAEVVMKKASSWSHPLLLMHGTEDRLGIITGSEAFFAKISGDVTFKRWNKMYHELHNEPEKAEVIQTMVDWILKRA
jgi:alpha-beta hydrolase superfamily lysophospholipase